MVQLCFGWDKRYEYQKSTPFLEMCWPLLAFQSGIKFWNFNGLLKIASDLASWCSTCRFTWTNSITAYVFDKMCGKIYFKYHLSEITFWLPCIQCIPRSASFWRSCLIRIYTVSEALADMDLHCLSNSLCETFVENYSTMLDRAFWWFFCIWGQKSRLQWPSNSMPHSATPRCIHTSNNIGDMLWRMWHHTCLVSKSLIMKYRSRLPGHSAA